MLAWRSERSRPADRQRCPHLGYAGIAASDALCCKRLGKHAKGADHREAVDLPASVDRALASDLKTLLAMKTQAGYRAQSMTVEKHTRALRAATRLVEAATAA